MLTNLSSETAWWVSYQGYADDITFASSNTNPTQVFKEAEVT